MKLEITTPSGKVVSVPWNKPEMPTKAEMLALTKQIERPAKAQRPVKWNVRPVDQVLGAYSSPPPRREVNPFQAILDASSSPQTGQSIAMRRVEKAMTPKKEVLPGSLEWAMARVDRALPGISAEDREYIKSHLFMKSGKEAGKARALTGKDIDLTVGLARYNMPALQKTVGEYRSSMSRPRNAKDRDAGMAAREARVDGALAGLEDVLPQDSGVRSRVRDVLFKSAGTREGLEKVANEIRAFHDRQSTARVLEEQVLHPSVGARRGVEEVARALGGEPGKVSEALDIAGAVGGLGEYATGLGFARDAIKVAVDARKKGVVRSVKENLLDPTLEVVNPANTIDAFKRGEWGEGTVGVAAGLGALFGAAHVGKGAVKAAKSGLESVKAAKSGLESVAKAAEEAIGAKSKAAKAGAAAEEARVGAKAGEALHEAASEAVTSEVPSAKQPKAERAQKSKENLGEADARVVDLVVESVVREAGQAEGSSLKHAETAKYRSERDLPEYERTKRTVEAAVSEAHEKGLVQKAESIAASAKEVGRVLSDAESAAVALKIDELHTKELDIANALKKGVDEAKEAALQDELSGIHQKLGVLYEGADRAGSAWSSAGRMRQVFLKRMDTESGMLVQLAKVRRMAGERLKKEDFTAAAKYGKTIERLKERLIVAERRATEAETNVRLERIQSAGAKKAAARAKIGRAASGELNTLVTKDAYEEAVKKLLSGPRGPTQVGAGLGGVDPRPLLNDLGALKVMVGYHVERGARTVAAIHGAIVADLGEKVAASDIHEAIRQYLDEREGARAEKQVRQRAKRIKGGAKAGPRVSPSKVDKDLPPRMVARRIAQRMEGEYRRAKKYIDSEHEKARVSNMSSAERVWHSIGKAIATSRGIQTGLDISAGGRQGWIASIPRPKAAVKAFRDQMKALKSVESADDVWTGIKAHKEYKSAARVGLLDDLMEKAGQFEEGVPQSYAENLGLFGAHPFAAGERAYKAYLGRIRMETYASLKKMVERKGEPLTAMEEEALAFYTKVATGRGSWKHLDEAMSVAGKVLFAPRFVLSRFQHLAGIPIWKAPTWRVKRALIEEYATFYGMMGVGLTAAAAAGAELGREPTSADLGKIKLGDTRIDAWAGLSQAARLLASIAALKTTGPSGQDREKAVKDLVADFLSKKAAPVPSALLTLHEGKNAIGEKTSPLRALGGLVIPLGPADAYDVVKKYGPGKGGVLGALALGGIGVSDYAPHRPGISKGAAKVLSNAGYYPGKPRKRDGETDEAYEKRVMARDKEISEVVEAIANDKAFKALQKEDRKQELQKEVRRIGAGL